MRLPVVARDFQIKRAAIPGLPRIAPPPPHPTPYISLPSKNPAFPSPTALPRLRRAPHPFSPSAC